MGNSVMNAHIYLVTNKSNGKQYVGQTISPKNRVGHGMAITDAYKKYGKSNFDYEKICTNITNKTTLNYLERFWIKVMDCRAPNGYNLEEGGSTKGLISDITRIKLRDANLGKVVSIDVRNKIRDSMLGKQNPFYGKKHTAETLKKIGSASIGRKKTFSKDARNKISMANKGVNNGMYGKKHTAETREKFKFRPLPTLLEATCPHCGTHGKGGSMIRWHMDNCKNLVVI